MNGSPLGAKPIKNPCPIMSRGTAVVLPIPRESMIEIAGKMPVPVNVLNIEVECTRERCPLWDKTGPGCGLNTARILDAGLSNIDESIGRLESIFTPPKGGPSPIARIAEALEAIVKHQQEKRG